VEAALADRVGGEPERITSSAGIGGGCISHGLRLSTDRGHTYFLKWKPQAPAGMFEAETDGLVALRAPDVLRVPEPLAHGTTLAGESWLLLEHVAGGPRPPGWDARLGRGLAAVHDAAERDEFGWHRDNWIGSLPQGNEPTRSWGDFWRERRIAPQLERARQAGHLKGHTMDRLLGTVDAALEGVERPALLHGDLWSGNAYAAVDGAPVVIDPAVYVGDGEVDLAMTELFGGFGRAFYSAYAEARGISEAYASHRRALYQLYYLLVHVNLFGASYVAPARRAAEEVLAAV